MPYTSVTLAQLRTRLQAKFESVPFFTTTEQNLAINEALQWYNLYTGVWRRRLNIPTVADQVYYTLPSPLNMGMRIDYNGQPIVISSLPDIDNGNPAWEGETTATDGVPNAVSVWIPIDLHTFAIWPADHDGSNSLLLDGVTMTPTLLSDSDTIDLPDSEIDAIIGEALCLVAFKDPSRAPRLIAWHQEFLRTVMARNARLNASDAFRQAAGVNQGPAMRPAEVSLSDGN